jgi:hypothetical protein
MGLLSKITGIFGGGGMKAAMDGATGILKGIDSLSTSAEEKAALRSTVVSSIVNAQSAVIQSEMQHGTWLSRSWRPLVMLSFAGILVAHFALFPLIVFVGWADVSLLAIMVIPAEMWTLLQVGLGGYVGGRTVEKLAKTVMPNMKMAKLKRKLLKRLTPEEVATLLKDD